MESALLNVKDARDLKINAGQYDVVANVKNTDAAAFDEFECLECNGGCSERTLSGW